MREDICKLCLQRKKLRDSHFMPRGLYRRSRDSKRQNANPIVISRKVTATTSKQPTDYVFCLECEHRLNMGGENWLMKAVAYGRRFPLRERLDVAMPMLSLSEAVVYSGRAVGVATEKLAYFALSMVWRGSVHEWPQPFRLESPRLDIGNAEEAIRQYLMGEIPFPDDAAVVVHVCDDYITQDAILHPCQARDGSTSYEMITRGIHFFVYLGDTVTPVIREMCCVSSPERKIFRRDFQNRTVEHFVDLMRTSHCSKGIKSEFPD